jgi:hypothetical protein
MRQVFTSARLENVESVAALLREAGIEIKMSEGRSYKKVSRREFSYVERKAGGNQPSIWVIKPDDYKRARELLHGMGLLDATPIASYVPAPLQFKDGKARDPQQRMMKIRMALIFIVGAIGTALVLRNL